MICDISNASPSNISVDAEHNVQFQFVFYGDGCKGTHFILYDATDTTAAPKMLSTYLYDERRTYYNGEEIDANTNGTTLGGEFLNGRSYIWKARMYENVDIGKGVYPSVRRTSGEIAKPCFFFGKIQAVTPDMNDKQIPIEKKLDITLPMWMRIGDNPEYRIITSYDPITGICTLKNAFDTYPETGSQYSLSSVRSYDPNGEIENNQLFIEKNITELTNAEFDVRGTGHSGYCWFMEIHNNYVAITGYDPETGIVTLETPAFSAEGVGTKYNIWTSFIDSRFYAITTKPTPRFSNAIGYADGENILFEAELEGTHLIKYYWLDIYEDDVLVETTQQIRMAKLSYYFKKAKAGKQYHAVFHVVTQDGMVNQEDSAWWKSSGTATNVTNKCGLIVLNETRVGNVAAAYSSARHAVCLSLFGEQTIAGVLKTGNVVSTSELNIGNNLEYTVSAGDYILFGNSKAYQIISYTKCTGILKVKSVISDYYPAGSGFKICPKLFKEKNIKYRVLRECGSETTLIGDYDATEIYDYTSASGTEYNYIIQPHQKITETIAGETHYIHHYYKEQRCPFTVPAGKAWAIYELTPLPYKPITNDDTRIFYPYQDSYSEYKLSEVWLAALDIDPAHSITQNINRVVYTGDRAKPVAVAGKNDYDSFSLSFTVGGVSCPNGRIEFGKITDIEKWKAFIARGNLVMLKDPDGSVWAGAITANSYDKTHYGSRTEYKITFEFTELKDVDSILVKE